MGRSNARGFSLLELMVALAIVTIVAWLLFHVLSQTLLTARMQAQDDLEQSTIGQLVDNLTTEQDDAWAIYVPPTDVFGKSDSDGHEVDFFARDGKQRPYFWAYSYDKTAQTLTRYRFTSPGGMPAQDTAYTGITKFYTHTYPLTALQDPLTPVYSTLYNGAALRSGIVHFYPGIPWIAGGNNITYVHIEGTSMKQDLQLATNTAPSGFTVVVYYTPSPSPTPASPFKTWPAQLIVGASGSAPWTTTGTVAMIATRQWIARAINSAIGGSIAQAATAGKACSALAENAAGTGADTSLPPGSPILVDSNGCELDSSGNALAQPVILAYQPSGTSETFSVPYNGCGSGTAQVGPWNPYSGTGATVQLDVTGQSAGTCSVTLGDGVSTQTPAADAGSVSVTVQSVDLAESGSGDTCTAGKVNAGNVTLSCQGTGTVTYNATCYAAGSEHETVLSGNASGAGNVWSVNRNVALSTLPTTQSGWATTLDNALTTVLTQGGKVALGTTVTTGCPL